MKFGEDVAFSKSNGSVEFVVDKKDAETLSEKSSLTECRKLNSNSNPDLCDTDITNAKSSNSSGAKGNEMVASVLMNNCVGRKDPLYPQDEIKQKDMKSCGDEKRKVSRLDDTRQICS